MKKINTKIKPTFLIVLVFFLIFLIGLFLRPLIPTAQAAVPHLVSYQGKLTDSNGVAVPDGDYDMTIKIYDASTGGNCLWTARGTPTCACTDATSRTVTVDDGIFSILLGDTGDCALDLDFNSGPYYLGVKVGTDSEMTPRRTLGSVPMAYNSETLNGLSNSTSGADEHIVATDASGNLTVDGKLVISTIAGDTETSLSLPGTTGATQGSSLRINASTDAPATPAVGDIYSDGTDLYFYNGTTWDDLTQTGSATGDFASGGDTATADRTLGNNDSFALSFETNDTPRIHLTADGKVGIGTTGPGEKLTIVGDGNTDATASLNVLNSDLDSMLYVRDDGKVGIGTSSPESFLHVQSEEGKGSDLILDSFGSSVGSNIWFRRAGGTINNPTIIPGDVSMGGINAWGYDGSQYIKSTSIEIETDGTPMLGSVPSRIMFKTTADGASNEEERMRITSSGNVGIGSASPSAELEVNGSLIVNNDTADYLGVFRNPSYASLRLGQDANNSWQLQWGANDELNISNYTSGSHVEHMRITSSGNVGIGTTAPTAQLHTQGNLSQALTGTVSVSASSDAVTGSGTAFTTELSVGSAIKIEGETFTVSDITSDTALTLDSTHTAGASGVTAYTDPDLMVVDTGDSARALTVTPWGSVGIGTDNPRHGLSIVDRSLFFYNTGNSTNYGWQVINRSDGGLSFHENLNSDYSGLHRMRIDAGGNLGIGTTTPNELLTVEGVTSLAETTAPTNTSGYGKVYVKSSDSKLYFLDSIGNEYDLTAGGTAGKWSNATVAGDIHYSSGDVGIGTNDPGERLVVVGGGNTSSTGSLNVLNSDSTSMLYVRDDGTVGISTTSPDSKLDILDASNPQLRLTHTDGSIYTDFQTDLDGTFKIFPSGGTTEIRGEYTVLKTISTNDYSWHRIMGPNYAGIQFGNDGNGDGVFDDGSGTGDEEFWGIFNEGSTDNLLIYNYKNAAITKPFFIKKSNDNIGIGTTTPTARLHTQGNLSQALTGTVSVSASSDAVTGIGTVFTTELSVGSAIKIEGEIFTVSDITSDTALTLDSTHTAGASGVIAYIDPDLMAVDTGDGQRALTIGNDGYITLPGDRPITFDKTVGQVTVQGESTGWVTGYMGKGGSGTDLGGFGFYGSGDGLNKYWIGPSYTDPHLSILNSGSVGIGIDPLEQVQLYVDANFQPITANGTNYEKGMDIMAINYDISSGVTDSGYRIGIASNAYVSDADFQGTLNQQYGAWIRNGHYGSSAGHINTSYGVYIDTLTSGSTTIDNLYGLYQNSTSAKNYFAGNVGIGTTSPDQKLDIYDSGTLDTESQLRVKRNNNKNTSILIANGYSTDSRNYYLGSFDSGAGSANRFEIRTSSYNDPDPSTANNLLTILNGGNVGIGTTTPNERLTVKGVTSLAETTAPTNTSGYGKVYVKSSDSKLYFLDSIGNEYDLTAGGTAGKWSNGVVGGDIYYSSGDVGIGTNDPGERLVVVGSGNTSSTGSLNVLNSDLDSSLYVRDDGNVGIGTSSPNQKFHVKDGTTDFTVYDEYVVLSTTSGGYFATSRPSGGNNIGFALGDPDQQFNIVLQSDDNLHIRDVTNDIIVTTFKKGGNVGIGTTSPTAMHHTQGNLSEALTGTVSVSASSDAVTGSGTAFTTELSVGGAIKIEGETFTVSAITSDTALTLDSNHTAGASGVIAYTDPDLMAVDTGDGARALTVTPNGRVGIGTDSPKSRLHIEGIPQNEATIILDSNDIAPNVSRIEFQSEGTTLARILSYQVTSTQGHLRFYTTANGGSLSEAMRIDEAGKLGIGTTTPNELLTVEGVTSLAETTAPTNTSDYGKVYVKSSDSKLYFLDSIGNEYDLTAGGTAGKWSNGVVGGDIHYSSGDVGIGTNDPGERLVVVGGGNTSSTGSLNVLNSDSTSMLYVRDDGNVGIGTSSPGSDLHILDSSSHSTLFIEAASNYEPQIEFIQGGTNVWNIANSSSGVNNNFAIYNRARSKWDFFIYGPTGDVGLGTVTPTARLHTKGNLSEALTGTVSVSASSDAVTGSGTAFTTELSVGSAIKIEGETFTVSDITSDTALTLDSNHTAGASGVTAYTDPDLMAVDTGDSARALTVLPNGNVGIGTDSPGVKLEVQGGISVQGNEIVSSGKNLELRMDKDNNKAAIGAINRDVGQTWTQELQFYANELSFNLGGFIRANWDQDSLSLNNSTLNVSSTKSTNSEAKIYNNSSAQSQNYFPQLTLAQIPISQSYVNNFIIRHQKSSFGNYPSLGFISQNGTGDTAEYTRMFIDGYAGDVGIGTTTPNEKLTVEGVTSLVETTAPTNTSGYGKVYVKSSDSKLYFLDSIGNEYDLTAGGTSGKWSNATVAGDIYYSSGDVGIGTNDPGERLVVVGGGNTSSTGSLNVLNSDLDSSLYVRDDGNIGIGTSSPSSLLHIKKTAGDSFLKIENTGNTNLSGIFLAKETSEGTDKGVAYMRVQSNTSGTNSIFEFGVGENIQADSASTRLVISSSGNVGIGTTNPQKKLDIKDIYSFIRIYSEEDGYADIATTRSEAGYGYSSLRLNAQNNIVLNPTNKVGLGTTAPTAMLHTQGNLSQALTGTVSVSASSDAVTGSGTAFTTELSVGSAIKIEGETFTVSAITSDTALTLDSNHTAGATSVTAYTDPDLMAISNGDELDKLRINSLGNATFRTSLTSDSYTGTWTSPNQWDVTGSDVIKIIAGNQNTSDSYASILMAANGTYTGEATGRVGVIQSGNYRADMFFALRGDSGTMYERMRILDTGEVGIGTQSPNELLTVEGVTSLAETTAPTNTSGYGKVYVKSSDSKLYFLDSIGNEYDLTAGGTAGKWSNGVVGGDIHYSSGDVGIGTNDPGERLVVVGSGNTSSTGSLNVLNSDSTSMLYVRDDGNVGIGTSSPNQMLHLYESGSAGEPTLLLEAGVSENPTIKLKNSTQNWSFQLLGSGSDELQLKDITNSLVKFRFNPGLTGDAYIFNIGNFGLGTNSPTAQLHTQGSLSQALTGTVSVSASSDAVTGSGTVFTTELSVGSAIKIEGETFTVSAITSDTALTLDSNHTAGASGVTAYTDPDLMAVDTGDGARALTVTGDGNVGIGTSSPIAPLNLEQSLNNFNYSSTNVSGGLLMIDHTTTSNTNSTAVGLNSYFKTRVNSGVTESGYTQALLIQNSRNNGTDSFDDNGTLEKLIGAGINYGHTSFSSDTPVTNIAYGLVINNYQQSGQIDNAYDLFLTSSTGTGTVNNHYGIYQVRTSAKNYFAGNVGIGTNAPNEKLTIEGITSLAETTAPSNTSGYGKVYVKSSDSKLYFLDSIGNEYDLTAGGGTGKWSDATVAGDIYYSSGDVGIGTNDPGERLVVVGGGNTSSTGSLNVLNSDLNSMLYVRDDGKVGIGTSSPIADLSVEKSLSNFTETITDRVGSDFRTIHTSTTNRTSDIRNLNSMMVSRVESGVTDSGTTYGSVFYNIRNSGSDTFDDNGTLDRSIAANIQYGHNNSSTDTPITNKAYGLYVLSTQRSGTIDTAYDIYLDKDYVAGTTVNNHYGIYQEASDVKNYFAGKVGIGTDNPGASLEIVNSGPGLLLNRDSGASNTYIVFKTNTANDVLLDGGGSSEFLRVLIGGSERLRVASTGNVGIGTNAPNEKLTIEGITSLAETTAPTNTSGYGKVYVKSSDSKLYFLDSIGNEYDLTAGGTAGKWSNGVVGGDIYYSSGDVGIGTNDPGERLVVVGSGNTSSTGSLNVLNSDLTSMLYVRDDGNVGIGTSSPESILHLEQSLTNFNSVPPDRSGIYANIIHTTDTSGTSSVNALHGIIRSRVATGVTDSGFTRTADIQNLRNLGSDSFDDNGTLDRLYGIQMGYGHYDSSSDSPITNEAIGLEIINYRKSGQIGVAKDLYLSQNSVTSGTITDHYGIYQEAFTAKNYFAGNVGIGTTAPTAQLHTQGNLSQALTGTVSVSASSDAVTGTGTAFTTELSVGSAIKIADETFTVSAITSDTALTLDSNHTAGASGVTAYTDPDLMALDTGDGERALTVLPNGKVGIGTSSPEWGLHITSEGSVNNSVVSTNYSDSSSSNITFQRALGSKSSPSVVDDSKWMGGVVAHGYDGDSFETGALISMRVDGTVSDGVMPGLIGFRTTDSGGTQYERLTIRADGNVGIGTTSPSFKLTVSGNIGIEDQPGTDQTSSGMTAVYQVDVNATGIGACLYIASDGNLEEADADAASTMPCTFLALESGTGDKKVLMKGFMRNDAWNWTPGGEIYVSVTTGALTQTAPSGTGDQVQIVGHATHADRIYFDPDLTLVEIQ